MIEMNNTSMGSEWCMQVASVEVLLDVEQQPLNSTAKVFFVFSLRDV